MRLVRLWLKAYGPFTDGTIDFSPPGEASGAGLHLIYGANEAGKSSALRAILDLRFGIPLRSPDDFLHPARKLRVAGTFVAPDGAVVNLMRRKGRGVTLSHFDPATGESMESLAVEQSLETALSGGLERRDFEAMYGLNHARLREGGEQLLKGEGELGSALFAASAGSRGAAQILAELETDAKRLYNPHGRSQNAVINEAKNQLEIQRQRLREAQVRPADWQSLKRVHDQALNDLAEIDANLEHLRRRENELTELRTVAPLLKELDLWRDELERLEGVVELAENARDERLAAQQSLRNASTGLKQAGEELAACEQGLQGLVIEEALLEHADSIERLAAAVEPVAQQRLEAHKLAQETEQQAQELMTLAKRLAPESSLDQLLAALPGEADRVGLEFNLDTARRLQERLRGLREREAELRQADAEDVAPRSPLVAEEVRSRLLNARRRAQGLGEIGQRIAGLESDIEDRETGLRQAQSDLGVNSLADLRHARPLLEAQIVQVREQFTGQEQEIGRQLERARRLGADLELEIVQQRQLAAEGEVVTAETLQAARRRRDQGWRLIREAYIEGKRSEAEAEQAFGSSQPLPEAFETVQREADRKADLLRADATRAAGYEACAARIEDLQKRQAETAAGLERFKLDRQVLQNDWSEQLRSARLPMIDPAALLEWQKERRRLLGLATDRDRLVSERDRLLADMKDARDCLSQALHQVGQRQLPGDLAALIVRAVSWEEEAVAAAAEQSARARAERIRQQEQSRLGEQIAKAEQEMADSLQALKLWSERLQLAEGSGVHQIKARLDELSRLEKKAETWTESRRQLQRLQAFVDDFTQQASRLAQVLAEPAPILADDFAMRLRGRLESARQTQREKESLLRDQQRAEERQLSLKAVVEKAEVTLSELCRRAGVASSDRLPACEERSQRRKEAYRSLENQRRQLQQASGLSEEVLRERLQDLDSAALEGERERCREDIKRLKEAQARARQGEEEARHALEAVDTSDDAALAREGMESAAARYRSALQPWARIKLARALLLQAMNRFRERAQAPMLSAASSYFALMTDGRYSRLLTEEEKGRPILLAERRDGMRIDVAAMSEGTVDQLYLSLRLAALDLRRGSQPQMPLVLDDVLITSDDQRSGNILRALASFAEHGQILLFTHHQHLLELAEKTLGGRLFKVHRL
jgi:uncharacterized protein YhaN